jgi:hypothetical protein
MKSARKYSHPVGMAILDHLEDVPLSASELAQKIVFPREKIYYHIKKLEKLDLIYVAETQIINGITKKSFLKTDVGENDSDVIGSVKDLDRPEKEPISDPKNGLSPEEGAVPGEEEEYDSEGDVAETAEDTEEDVPSDELIEEKSGVWARFKSFFSGEEEQDDSEGDIVEPEEDTEEDISSDDLLEELPQEDRDIADESQQTDFEGDIQSGLLPEEGEVAVEEEEYDSEGDIAETEEDTEEDVPSDDLIDELPQEDRDTTDESQQTDFEGDIQSELMPEEGAIPGEEEEYDSEGDVVETEEDTEKDVPSDDLIEELPQGDRDTTDESQQTDFEGDVPDEEEEYDSSPLTDQNDEGAVSEDSSSVKSENADQPKEPELNEVDSDSVVDENAETYSKDSVLGKLLSGGNLPDKVETEEIQYDDTAEKDDLSETIIIENVEYLIPKADQSLSGIDYMVRSAQRKDGKAITLEDKESLRDHFETERVEKSEGEIEILPESIESEIHGAKKTGKSKKQGSGSWGLYLTRRLNGYYNSVTFSQIDNTVKFLRATLSRSGIKVYDQEIFSIPFNDNGETVEDLPGIIRFVYTNRIKKSQWKKYYLAYHTNKYSIEIDPLKTPDIKGKELESFITTNMAKRLSLDPGKAIMNWVQNSGKTGDPQNNYIVSVGDMERIQRDYEQLIENKIQPRFTTNLAKIQYDLYRYNYPEKKGDAILIAFGTVKTYITVVNNWEIKDSRTSVVSINDFIQLVTPTDEEELLIEKGNKGNNETDKILDTTIQLKAIDIKNNNKHVAIWEKLAAEIYVTLKYFKNQGHYISDDIYISGSGTLINNIEDCLSDDLGKNVTKLVFPETVSYDENVDLSQNVDFSTNIGLLLDPKDRLNVLPVEQRNNAKYLYPLNLTRMVGALLITLGSFFTFNHYLNLQEIKGQLAGARNELDSMSQQNAFYYDIAYKLAISDLIIGTKDYDFYTSTSVLNNLKFLSSSIPENILLDQYIFSRSADGANPIITIKGKISAPGSETNMVLNSLLYSLRDSKNLKQVTLMDQETAENGILRFTLDLTL